MVKKNPTVDTVMIFTTLMRLMMRGFLYSRFWSRYYMYRAQTSKKKFVHIRWTIHSRGRKNHMRSRTPKKSRNFLLEADRTGCCCCCSRDGLGQFSPLGLGFGFFYYEWVWLWAYWFFLGSTYFHFRSNLLWKITKIWAKYIDLIWSGKAKNSSGWIGSSK